MPFEIAGKLSSEILRRARSRGVRFLQLLGAAALSCTAKFFAVRLSLAGSDHSVASSELSLDCIETREQL